MTADEFMFTNPIVRQDILNSPSVISASRPPLNGIAKPPPTMAQVARSIMKPDWLYSSIGVQFQVGL